jgi:hypothetical protein
MEGPDRFDDSHENQQEEDMESNNNIFICAATSFVLTICIIGHSISHSCHQAKETKSNRLEVRE